MKKKGVEEVVITGSHYDGDVWKHRVEVSPEEATPAEIIAFILMGLVAVVKNRMSDDEVHELVDHALGRKNNLHTEDEFWQ